MKEITVKIIQSEFTVFKMLQRYIVNRTSVPTFDFDR